MGIHGLGSSLINLLLAQIDAFRIQDSIPLVREWDIYTLCGDNLGRCVYQRMMSINGI